VQGPPVRFYFVAEVHESIGCKKLEQGILSLARLDSNQRIPDFSRHAATHPFCEFGRCFGKELHAPQGDMSAKVPVRMLSSSSEL
jgi:hypothetical protein